MRNGMDNSWVKRNKWIFVVGPLALAAFIALFGEVTKLLWNWLTPMLFGWRHITFWQAMGLLILCRLLFGGLSHGGKQGSGWRRRKREKWEAMTPEEREKFRQSWQARCGGFPPPPTETRETT